MCFRQVAKKYDVPSKCVLLDPSCGPKVTKTYSKIHDDGISIFDKRIKKRIPIKFKDLIVSKKDKNLPYLDLNKTYFR